MSTLIRIYLFIFFFFFFFFLIKPADKGGATVIQNREVYIREGERQLSDSLFYQPLDTDPTESNNDKINCLITSLRIK